MTSPCAGFRCHFIGFLLVLLIGVGASCRPCPTQIAPPPPEVKEAVVGEGFNFTPQQTSNVIGNAMHDAHSSSAGIDCKECHRDKDEFLTHEAALELCLDCHEGRIVALDVWEKHCLTCHQFTKYLENYSESTHALNELCQDCHGEGSVIYRAFDPDSPHDVTCDNCHRPHRSALAISEDLCEMCHSDIAELISHENKVHGSCLVCHTPHSELPDSETLCGTCHIATANILMHSIPEHPTDCLACHSPHFAFAEISDEACQVCHDDEYYGGRTDLPDPHRDCHSCHREGDFQYLGDEQCAACHAEITKLQELKILPDQHRDCATCHQAHSWSTIFENNCERCHAVDEVIEHQLSFHQADCGDCHDPHHIELMGKSGDCEACHGAGIFPGFRADLPEMHVQCLNCHTQVSVDTREFDFDGPEDTCMVCHSTPEEDEDLGWEDVPSGHQICQGCHKAHSFDTRPENMRCDTCHRAIFEDYPSKEHEDCSNCHDIGHAAEFTGREESCDVCHSEQGEQIQSEIKADCMLCHAQHEFEAAWDDCTTCHEEPPGLHETHSFSDCSDCHVLHSLQSDPETCKTCHEELAETCEPTECWRCHAFK